MNAHTPPMTGTAALAARAMIVSLSISQWSGRRLDREVTEEVNQQHNAAADAGRYNKLLLPKDALADVVSIVSATRNEFIHRTLPWMDNGSRIMSADAYLDHMQWVRSQKAKFESAVDAFITAYPGYVSAAAARLSTMFKPEDYPAPDELRAKFGMEVRVLPVPNSKDFRVTMSDEDLAAIRADIERDVTRATKEAVRNVYERVEEVTRRMVERLNGYRPAAHKGDRAEGIFRDSLVGNIRDLIDVMPALNITGDPALFEMTERLKPLAKHDASALRDDPELRRNVANEAKAVLDTIGDYFA